MKQIWFKKTGWLYMPVHPLGFLITAMAIIFMVPVVFAIHSNVHSVSDELYQVFVYGTCTAFWWKWVAEKISKRSNRNNASD